MNIFRLRERGATVRTEVLAGCTTFLTLSYIIFVNPAILSQAGMDADAVLVATCLASALGCLLMGLYANYPIALAPGMGLNAYFVAMATGVPGLSWQIVLGAVFCSGILMLILSVLPVREWVLNSMPRSQKLGIVAGDRVLPGAHRAAQRRNRGGERGHHGRAGDRHRVARPCWRCSGSRRSSRWRTGTSPGPCWRASWPWRRWGGSSGCRPRRNRSSPRRPRSRPPRSSWTPSPQSSSASSRIVFAFLMVDLFDSSATLAAVLSEAGLTDEDGRVPRLRRALVADSTATMAGAMLGTSTTTSYVESAAGVRAGGRTGLTAVVVAGLFLLATLIAPVATSVPAFATAPAILFVGYALTRSLRGIDWDDLTDCVPRDGHRAGHAVHLLDRHRDRPRLHHLRAGQGAGRARARAELGVGPRWPWRSRCGSRLRSSPWTNLPRHSSSAASPLDHFARLPTM